jgi:hypothetical protein
MIAAHCCAAVRAKQIAHPGANLTGYTAGGGGGSDIFQIPRPYDVADYPTATEIKTALNNGFCPISFDNLGKASIVRQITTRSLLSSGVNDYRAREGHLPSVLAAFWQELFSLLNATKQPFVAADPAQGQKPLALVTYPSAVKKLTQDLMGKMADAFIGGSPVLDPGTKDAMVASVETLLIAGGISIKANPIAVIHHNKTQALIGESSPAY